MKAIVDQAGRIVIPQSVRDALRLRPGDSLEVEANGEELRLRLIQESSPLVRKGGVLVHTGKAVGDLENAVQKDREDRADHLLRHCR